MAEQRNGERPKLGGGEASRLGFFGRGGCGLGGKTLGSKAAVLIGWLWMPRRASPGCHTTEVESDSGASPSRARRRETS
jgi:hypothetical protein